GCIALHPCLCIVYLPDTFFELRRDLLVLHSFPTRRSSDLEVELAEFHVLLRDGVIVVLCQDGTWIDGTPAEHLVAQAAEARDDRDRKSTRLNSSHVKISYAVFCLKKKTTNHNRLTRVRSLW